MDYQSVISVFATQFLAAVLPVLASLLAAWVLVKARAAWAQFRRDHAPEAWYLEEVAKMAVRAAEQANVAGLVADKREYACAVISDYLATHGYTISVDVIYAAIEAAVLTEFKRPTQADAAQG